MIQNDSELDIAVKWRNNFKTAMNITIAKMPEKTFTEIEKKRFFLETQQNMLDIFNEDIKEYLATKRRN